MSKNQFTGTATQPQRNRKFCQFNKDPYCSIPKLFELSSYTKSNHLDEAYLVFTSCARDILVAFSQDVSPSSWDDRRVWDVICYRHNQNTICDVVYEN